MEEKRYLNWYNKIGYGSGDIAGNVVYALLSAFVMIYLTDTIGMNSGVVGTLIAASKLFDGVSDVFFGSMIDKTHTKMGKARPWMFYGYFGCAVCLVAVFCVPVNMGAFAQYAWFFVAYTMLNAGFYTANNIAYSSLTALITRNNHERVQMGSIRFIFAFGTSMLIQTITVSLVAYFGGTAAAWRTVAIVYAIVGIITNTISVMSVKELPPEETEEPADAQEDAPQMEKYSLIATCSEYTYRKTGMRVDGTMYSCTSLGTKLGGGIGTALAGWLLAFSGYVSGALVQSASCINMLHIMYLWIPFGINLLITLILSRLKVEQAVDELMTA